MDICATSETTLFRSAHIVSPGYPNAYASDAHCSCDVTTEPSQKILLTMVDFAVEWSGECRKDVLRFNSNSNKLTRNTYDVTLGCLL